VREREREKERKREREREREKERERVYYEQAFSDYGYCSVLTVV
jgi:hypothetical protein